MKKEFVLLRTSAIKPYENNPRINDSAVDAVIESINQCEYIDPIEIDENNVILSGHTRLKALQKLKIKSADCIRVTGLTEEQKRKYRLLTNKTGELADWDLEKLGAELDDLDFGDFDFGFDLPEENDEPQEISEDNYGEPAPKQPKSKLGDIYELGNHRLICGDCADKNVVDKLMNGEKADLCFQSPPYNIGKNAQLNDRDDDNKYINYNDDNPEYRELLAATTENAINNSKYVAVNIQMLSGNKKDFVLWLSDFKDYLCDIAIWYKDNVAPAMARRVMNSAFEFVIFFSNENQSRAIGTNDFRGTVSNVYQSHIQSGNEYSKIHSATFPISFVGHFIECFTNKGNTVLDLFGGSGSTLIACEQLNRRCFMCELDPKYVDVIIDRWEKFTGKKAVKLK